MLILTHSASPEAAQHRIPKGQQICDSILTLLTCNPVLCLDNILEDRSPFS